jgi:hypothetical protein
MIKNLQKFDMYSIEKHVDSKFTLKSLHFQRLSFVRDIFCGPFLQLPSYMCVSFLFSL